MDGHQSLRPELKMSYSPRLAAAGSGHSRALIEKNQALRRDPADGLREGLLLLLIRFGVAFAALE